MTPNMAAALVAAQKSARAVRKDARNQHHGYDYASSESIIDEARVHLSASGLSLITIGWEPVPVGAVTVRYLLSHESGESQELVTATPCPEGKGRPIDKAVLGGITVSLSYLLRGLLLLPRLDELPVDQRDDRGHDPEDARAARAQLEASAVTDLEAAIRAAITMAELDMAAARARSAGLTGSARATLAAAFRETRDAIATMEETDG
uniref:Putative Erf family protein n=1 Tax=viral metagenome TaxID=1070528 RepID=A0A6M3IKW6_9ZZZZ